MLIPNGNQNQISYTYLGLLIILIVAYIVYMTVGGISKPRGNKNILRSAGIERRFFSAVFTGLAGYDYLTLKPVRTQPFVPCMNYILNTSSGHDKAWLIESTLHTLRLLFRDTLLVSLGLVTGIMAQWILKEGPLLD